MGVFAIRVDSSLEIGTGHLRRCLTLAEGLRDKGAEVHFICRPHAGNLVSLIEASQFSVHLLSPCSVEWLSDQAWMTEAWLGASKEEDRDETLSILRVINPEWLIVDHYGIDASWETPMREVISKIMVIDDLADRFHDCELLLDQNYYVDAKSQYSGLLPDTAERLIGPNYALLRREFAEQRQKGRDRTGTVQRLLVCFGGSDPDNLTGQTLVTIESLQRPDIRVDVVVGQYHPAKTHLEKLCQRLPNTFLHIQSDQVAELMQKADLAIGAGGAMTWERLCLGLPCIVFCIAENQRQLIAQLLTTAVIWADPLPGRVIPLREWLISLLSLPSQARRMGEVGAKLVDGRGVGRVIRKLRPPVVQIRLVHREDATMIWSWRNHPLVREHFHSNRFICFEDHMEWFEQILGRKDQYLLIGQTSGQSIGVVRFDVETEFVTVSIYLNPCWLHEGYGGVLLAAAQAWLETKIGPIKLRAEVKVANHASHRLFEKAGFVQDHTVYYRSTTSDDSERQSA